MTRRNNIVLIKRENPKRVDLPNGRTFYAKLKELRMSIFRLIYKLDVVISKELLHVEGDDGDQLNKVEEGLNLSLKKG